MGLHERKKQRSQTCNTQSCRVLRCLWFSARTSVFTNSVYPQCCESRLPRRRQAGDTGEVVGARDPQSGDRFRFRLMFELCVRASGRGEVVRVREECLATMGLNTLRCAPPGLVVFQCCCFYLHALFVSFIQIVAICVLYVCLCVLLMLRAWVC